MEAILSAYDKLTAINNHTEAALVILKEFGTLSEIDAMTAIKKRTEKRNFILLCDQIERQLIMKKYNVIISMMKHDDRRVIVLHNLVKRNLNRTMYIQSV
jgi:hypothetical protein